MGIAEGFVSGLFQAFSFDVFPYLLAGSLFGLVIGIIPGLSGHFAMAMAIPFLYTMAPNTGIAFLLGAHAGNIAAQHRLPDQFRAVETMNQILF